MTTARLAPRVDRQSICPEVASPAPTGARDPGHGRVLLAQPGAWTDGREAKDPSSPGL